MTFTGATYSAILMLLSAITSCLVIGQAWRKQAAPGRTGFILMMAAAAVYAFFTAFSFFAATLLMKVFWIKVSYLGAVNVAPSWFLFSLTYSQPKSKISPRLVTLLWLIPLVTLGLAATNEWHHLIWTSFAFASQESTSWLILGHGLFYWLHGMYAYLLILTGTLFLIRTAWHSPTLFRRQVALIILASLFPWVGNILYIFHLEPWHGLDLTPICFAFSGFLLAENLYRLRTFDLVPVARHIVFNSLGAGVLVLDYQNRLVDINPVARSWTGLGEEAIGRNLQEVLPLNGLTQKYENMPVAQAVIEIGEGENRRIYNLTISPILNEAGDLQGRVVTIYDISQEHNLLESEQRRLKQMELLNTITQAALSISDQPVMLQTLADRVGELFEADGAYLTLWDEAQGRAVPLAAYGELRDRYAAMTMEAGEVNLTESVLTAGHVLAVEDTSNTPYLSPRVAVLFPAYSNLALPLIANGQKLGAAIISFNQLHHFTDEEIALGEQAAGQVALAFAKSQLYEAEHKRNAQLTALQSISRLVASSLDLNYIFETVVQLLNHTFGYRYVSIYRLNGDTLQLGAQVGYPEEMMYPEIPIGRGVLGRAARTRQPQFVRDVQADPDYLRASHEVGSEICVPLLKDQTVFGTLNVESANQVPLTEEDMKLLITFASQVAVAIDNANLFKAEQEQRKLADALRQMGLALGESLNLESVLSRLLEEIQQVVPYDRASVMLVEEERKRARITHLRDNTQPAEKTVQNTVVLEFNITQTPSLRKMMETGQPQVAGDLNNNPGWTNDPSSIDLRSWVGSPIMLHGEVIGFLSMYKREANFYHPKHSRTLAAFAGQAAIAIENARIFTEMQRVLEKERLLFAATNDFTAGLDTEAVLKAIVHHMVKALKVDGCAVSSWDPIRNCVVTLLDYDPYSDSLPDPSGNTYSLVDYPLTRMVIESRRPAYIHLDDPKIDPAEAELLRSYGNQALLMLPLIVGRDKQVFGIIELFRKENVTPFSKADLELAQSFAAQAAIAIENARLYAETQHLAIVDELTGLYNRRGLFDLGRHELERAIRFNHPLVALFLDIDHFKQFNDTYSYSVGDEVLRMFASCLRANLREFDLVGRYGGEEFVVLLPEADLHAACEVAERVRTSVQALRIQTNKGETGITVSIGVCARNGSHLDLDGLIERAGQALHRSKEEGRNRVVVEEG